MALLSFRSLDQVSEGPRRPRRFGFGTAGHGRAEVMEPREFWLADLPWPGVLPRCDKQEDGGSSTGSTGKCRTLNRKPSTLNPHSRRPKPDVLNPVPLKGNLQRTRTPIRGLGLG